MMDEGNFVAETATQLDCQKAHIMVSGEWHYSLWGLVLRNIVTVVMDDGASWLTQTECKDVRDVVDHLEQAGIAQASPACQRLPAVGVV